jgi:hypothetical protein
MTITPEYHTRPNHEHRAEDQASRAVALIRDGNAESDDARLYRNARERR